MNYYNCYYFCSLSSMNDYFEKNGKFKCCRYLSLDTIIGCQDEPDSQKLFCQGSDCPPKDTDPSCPICVITRSSPNVLCFLQQQRAFLQTTIANRSNRIADLWKVCLRSSCRPCKAIHMALAEIPGTIACLSDWRLLRSLEIEQKHDKAKIAKVTHWVSACERAQKAQKEADAEGRASALLHMQKAQENTVSKEGTK